MKEGGTPRAGSGDVCVLTVAAQRAGVWGNEGRGQGIRQGRGQAQRALNAKLGTVGSCRGSDLV